MPQGNEVWINVSLDGDRIYSTGGIRLAPGAQEKTVDKALALFRQMREKFRPDLEEAKAPPEGWPWTDVVVARLPVKTLMEHVTVEEAREIPFPIPKVFGSYDTTGRLLGEVLDENPGLLSWLAMEAAKKEGDVDALYPKMKLGIVGARVLVNAAVKEKLEEQAKEEEDF